MELLQIFATNSTFKSQEAQNITVPKLSQSEKHS